MRVPACHAQPAHCRAAIYVLRIAAWQLHAGTCSRANNKLRVAVRHFQAAHRSFNISTCQAQPENFNMRRAERKLQFESGELHVAG